MARITIEDCLEKVHNHFDVTRMASLRARQLEEGSDLRISPTGNGIEVHALREIAEGQVDTSILHQKEQERDDAAQEIEKLLKFHRSSQKYDEETASSS